jgi:hypothetical protein
METEEAQATQEAQQPAQVVLDTQSLQDIRVCDICGQRFIAGYGYSLGLCWLVTGHASISAFMCPESRGNQHWGCTVQHALEAAIKCANEHMIPLLAAKHSAAQELGLSRVSTEHAGLFDESNEQFHFVKE